MNNTYDNYAYYRDLRKFTDYKISALAGVSASTISDWKLGKHYPRATTLKKIAEILGIDVNAFYNGIPMDHYQPISPDSMSGTQKMLEEAKFHYDTSFSVVHDRVIEYNIKMTDGTSVLLTPQEYKDLQDAVSIFIDAWIKNKKMN